MDHEKRKIHILIGLPVFLAKHLLLGKVRYALHQVEDQPASDFLWILQPDNFKSFLNQVGVPEKMYIHGGESHGSDVKHTMRIKIMSTCDHGLPGKSEDVLGGKGRVSDATKRLLNFHLHSYRLLPPSNESHRRTVGEDRGFEEAESLCDCGGENGVRGD